jgi:hypothetical protein
MAGAGRNPDRGEATDTWDDQAAVERLVGEGGHFVCGGAGSQAAGRSRWSLRRVLGCCEPSEAPLAGTEPVVPPVPGLAGTSYWTLPEGLWVAA